MRLAENEYKPQVMFSSSMQIEIDNTLLKGKLKEQESMSRYTTWKTGGCVDYYYRPSDLEDLAVFLSMLPKEVPVTWVGFGSNLLVRDGGLNGVVISVNGVLDTLELIGKTEIKIGAGLSCAKVARFAGKHGLSGIEFLAGIPGTVGGALAMNAGAYGGEIWRYVDQVETINRKGEIKSLGKDSFEIGYRSVSLSPDEWFISASLTLEVSEKEKVEQSIRKLLAARADAQPLGQLSCGSVFRNPPDDHAARLIDSCGLKGKQIGGASVSEKHANFIINSANASAADIERLITYIQETVYEKHRVRLIPEVRIIGESVETGGKH